MSDTPIHSAPGAAFPSPSRLLAALSACCVVATAALAHADTADGTLEEVIVSDFRPSTRQDLPASIELLDRNLIGDTSLQHFEELTQLVPNLNWAGGASRPRYFQIRGIGERSQYEGAPNPSVGFIIDDLDFSSLGGIATLFDVQQIEVLRGPQGTRYGANALAGLIYVKYREPSDEFDLNVQTSAGNDGLGAVGVAAGGPLGDTLAYRLAVHRQRSDGFRDNAFLDRDDTNGRDELSTRLKLRYTPDDRWQFDLTGMFVELDNGYDAFAVDNGLTTQSDRPGRDTQRTLGGVLNVEAALSDAFTLYSITGVSRSDVTFSFDADWGNADFWAPFVYDFFSATRRDRQSINQEVRLMSTPGRGGVDWIVGVNLLNTRESNITRDDGNFEGDTFAAVIAREYEATSRAVFGDLTFDLGDRVALNAGLRIERRAADYSDSAGDRFSPDEQSVGGQLALSVALPGDSSAYARVSRGYKAGGFNLGLPAEADNDALLYDAEFLWNYEIGLRGRWLDDRLALNATAFWMQRRDQQVQTSTQLDPNNPATFVFLTDNAGRGRNYGVEISADFAASERLSAYASLGLLRTKIEEFGDNAALAGRDQAHAPRYSFALGGRYDFDRGWFARLDISGRDAFYFSDSHAQRSSAYALVNARVGIERSGWSLYGWGRNLFDERYAVRGFFFGNEPARNFADTLYVRLGDPRQLGVTFEYRYLP